MGRETEIRAVTETTDVVVIIHTICNVQIRILFLQCGHSDVIEELVPMTMPPSGTKCHQLCPSLLCYVQEWP